MTDTKPDENADALASLAEGLLARELAPDGDYPIVATTLGVIDQLKSDNVALAAALAKAEKKAKNAATPRAPSARNVGPIKRTGDQAEPSPELVEAIEAADDVEIAFSDGKKEIRHLPAFGVTGESAWSVTPAGLVLTVPLHVHPQSACTVRGYGLFLDGKLAAYRPRMDALEIPAGREQQLTGDVVF